MKTTKEKRNFLWTAFKGGLYKHPDFQPDVFESEIEGGFESDVEQLQKELNTKMFKGCDCLHCVIHENILNGVFNNFKSKDYKMSTPLGQVVYDNINKGK